MSRPRILIYIHYLEIGGAERAAIGLLNALDPERVDVDLLVNQHTGEFMSLVPAHVNLLPELPEYSAIERPIARIVREGHVGIAMRRLLAKWEHGRYLRRHPLPEGMVDESIFQYVFRRVVGGLRDLSYLGRYDLAISFLHPHNIVLRRVRARHKVCWVHTDYSTVRIDPRVELPVWGAYERIAAISDQAARAFADAFPTLADRVVTIENILSPASVRRQAQLLDVTAEMPPIPEGHRILSVGRYTVAKRFEHIPRMCRLMLDGGLRVRWYILGYGDDTAIRQNIQRYGVEDAVVLLGRRSNPYPYMAACDIYAQPSLFEGKSVTVREAQILGRPVVISDYPTARSQVVDGVDGVIVPMDVEQCAAGIADFARDAALRADISRYLATHDYGNESEVDKLYALLH